MMGCYIKVNVSNAYIKIKKSKMARRGRIEFSFFVRMKEGSTFILILRLADLNLLHNSGKCARLIGEYVEEVRTNFG